MPIFLAFLAGLLAAAAIGAVRLAGRRTLRQLPGSNQDWVWY
ncbi:MAG: hypothetical protein REJ24_13060 [Rhodocyclaceae bacterium]|nr:hypothetical protein [Rhodocyclaceae bacterium]MDQ8001348.1 hypothetical protein [Pseudomonadota bacterium]